MQSRFLVSVFVVVAMIFGLTNSASADQWDYTYGEDPTNEDNVSSFTEVRIDPTGGAWLIGYFAGQFEGLSSVGQLSRFIQHRSSTGQIDFTLRLEEIGVTYRNIPPSVSDFVVDGEGIAYVRLDAGYTGQDIVSVSRPGSLVRYSSAPLTSGYPQSSRDCSNHMAMASSPVSGLYRLCSFNDGQSLRLELLDKSFTIKWQRDVTQYTGDIWGPAPGLSSISVSSDDTVWLASDFNADNFNVDQALLPVSLRSAIGLTSFNGQTGNKMVAFKHYGYLNALCGEWDCQKLPQAIGNRQLWIRARSSSNGNQTLVLDQSNGSLIGTLATGYAWPFDKPTWGQTDQLVKNFNLKGNDALILRNLIVSGSWSAIGIVTNLAASDGKMVTYLRNDGRRLIVVKFGVSSSVVFVFDLIGDGVPELNKLVSATYISGSVKDADVDDRGNIVVVGSTFQQVVLPAGSRVIQSSTNERAFISRNPMGRISLDVLPRTPLRIKVAGTNGVPSTGVGAVSMNVTVTSPDGEGFITVYPCDSKPDASNLNYTLDQTVPNAVIAPVSSTGDVCFYTNAQTHLLADINGYFPTGQGFTAAGPTRVFDTRSGSAQGLRTVDKVKIGGDREVRVQMTGIAGITPSSGVGAVSLNITATGTTADDFGGYVTVYPCGDRPNASSLNFVSGQTVPNAVIAPVSASGEVCFYARGATDLIVDINGYFLTGAGFTPTNPSRIADTRSGSDQGIRTVTKTKVGGDTTLKVKFTDIAGLTPSSGVGAVSLNVTATGTTADEFGGYVTVYPCGALPNASNLNFVSGQIVPNAVIAPVSASGEVCFYARGTTDLIVDLNGYFLTGAGFAPMSPVRLFDTR